MKKIGIRTIQKSLRECVFDPNELGLFKVWTDTNNSEYYEARAIEEIQKVKFAPMESDLYLTNAIRLLTLSRIKRNEQCIQVIKIRFGKIGIKLFGRRKLIEPYIIQSREDPERQLGIKFDKFMEDRDWTVLTTHGNAYQSGLPDRYCCHYKYGTRWVELKIWKNYRFTPAQLIIFPKLTKQKVGIWVISNVAPLEEEYKKLFKPPNWHQYLTKGKY